jgi:hypothetical protein
MHLYCGRYADYMRDVMQIYRDIVRDHRLARPPMHFL